MAPSMFQRYGGFAAIHRIVSAFYDRVLDCPALEPYFQGVAMDRLIDHQTKFIASLMGGPASFSDDAIRRAHQHLGISESEMHTMATVLRETLLDHEVEAEDADEVQAALLRYTPLICAQQRASA
ncbi:MAG: group 1 truncated hemoglobin [Reyranellaceae bacterium]